MIRIKVKDSEIEKAKADMKVFDKQKTHNKFECKHNYIGLLGEMVLDRYLNEQDIEHEWIPFIKQGWTQPDFIIQGQSIDLKTSYTDKMWYTSAEHDVYIFAQLSRDDKVLTLKSWMTREGLEKSIKDFVSSTIRTYNLKTVYNIDSDKMIPICWLHLLMKRDKNDSKK